MASVNGNVLTNQIDIRSAKHINIIKIRLLIALIEQNKKRYK